MIEVGLLTVQQKDELIGQQYTADSFFNPIEDFNGNWVISQEEINFCNNSEFIWVKQLPLIEYQPKPLDPLYV
jgi:hypothetical protein